MADADDDTEDELMRRDKESMDRAMAILTGRFDNVTVFVSRFEGETGNTISSWRGRGNWFARQGQVREWVIKIDTEARVEASRDMNDDE